MVKVRMNIEEHCRDTKNASHGHTTKYHMIRNVKDAIIYIYGISRYQSIHSHEEVTKEPLDSLM
jgi:hypothetical protein